MKKGIIVTVTIILVISFSIVRFEIFGFIRIPKEYRKEGQGGGRFSSLFFYKQNQ